MSITPEFSIHIKEEVYQKIMYWVRRGAEARHEVSGFAPLEVDIENKRFVLRDAFMLEQECHATETEIDAKALGKAMYEMRNDPFGLKCHWHSHPKMGVFFSSTDRDLIHQLGGASWLLALVFNEREEVKSGLYTSSTDFFGVKNYKMTEDIPVKILRPIHPKRDEWSAEFEKCVIVPQESEEDFENQFGANLPTKSEADKIRYFNQQVNMIRNVIPDIQDRELDFDKQGFAHVEEFNANVYNPMEADPKPLGQGAILNHIEEHMFEKDVYLMAANSSAFYRFCTSNIEELFNREIVGMDGVIQ